MITNVLPPFFMVHSVRDMCMATTVSDFFIQCQITQCAHAQGGPVIEAKFGRTHCSFKHDKLIFKWQYLELVSLAKQCALCQDRLLWCWC